MKSPLTTFALTLLCATLAASAAAAATLHVEAAAPAAGADGSVAHPFGAIAAAVDAAVAGDTVLVGAGTFVEVVDVDIAVTITGHPGLRTVVQPADSWTLSAAGAELRGLLFEGDGGWSIGVEASRPFTVQDCQFQDFGVALWLDGVATAGVIRHNRIVGNTYGVVMLRSGHATYVLVENNQIVAPGATGGVYAYDTRWRGYHNQISGPSWGIYHRLPTSRNLPISYLRNNLITDAVIGVMGYGLDPYELKVQSNAIDAWQETSGLVAADVILTVDDDCGAVVSAQLDHGWVAGGACSDGGLFGADIDGSPTDIGPQGGSHGGDWWQALGCAGPLVFCPDEQQESWIETRLEVRGALWWFDEGTGAFTDYDAWSDDDLDGEALAADRRRDLRCVVHG